ncbi:MAG: guanylate kinase [Saprospiraceae bacterium]
MNKPSGKIIILTAPSGSGKTTLANYLLDAFPNLEFSVSATTRSPRPGEIEGKNYHFVSHEDFQELISNHELIEYQEVYEGCFYGTLKSELRKIWIENKVALFDIDVKGAYKMEQEEYANVLSIYIKASSLEVLRERLIKRGTETNETINKRISKAKDELEFSKYFDYVITNDNLDLAKKMLYVLVEDFMNRPIY